MKQPYDWFPHPSHSVESTVLLDTRGSCSHLSANTRTTIDFSLYFSLEFAYVSQMFRREKSYFGTVLDKILTVLEVKQLILHHGREQRTKYKRSAWKLCLNSERCI